MRAMGDNAQPRPPIPRHLLYVAAVVIVLTVTAVVALLVWGPAPQPLSYHRFKDGRSLLGLPNALNVLSNLPFLLVGVWGLWFVLFLPKPRGESANPFRYTSERWPFVVLFSGVALTGFGSSYYHLAPNNDRLVWDRLPMAMGFMGLIAAMISEFISRRLGSWLLGPLVALGVFSVLHWHWTEQRGQGDLRLYGFIQFYSLFLVVVMPLLFPARYTRVADWYISVGWYALAKVCEAADGPIYAALGGFVSGHTLKHLLGAVSTYWILHMLENRRPLSGPAAQSPLAPS
jgi:hypothetical protein